MYFQPPAIARFCRDLREADPAFWPQAAKGGGKGAAHVEPAHLVNLALALALAAPIAGIPKAIGNYRNLVRGYRALVPHRPRDHVPDPAQYGVAAGLLNHAGVFTGHQPLGVALERLVELLTDGDAAHVLETAGLYVELHTLRMPRAVVSYRTFDPLEDHTAPETILIYRPDTPIDRAVLPRRLIVQTSLIPASLFTVMAALWSDTKRHLAARRTMLPLPVMASASAIPVQEDAAALPGAAASNRRPLTADDRAVKQLGR
jgi:hypothetical protein